MRQPRTFKIRLPALHGDDVGQPQLKHKECVSTDVRRTPMTSTNGKLRPTDGSWLAGFDAALDVVDQRIDREEIVRGRTISHRTVDPEPGDSIAGTCPANHCRAVSVLSRAPSRLGHPCLAAGAAAAGAGRQLRREARGGEAAPPRSGPPRPTRPAPLMPWRFRPRIGWFVWTLGRPTVITQVASAVFATALVVMRRTCRHRGRRGAPDPSPTPAPTARGSSHRQRGTSRFAPPTD